LRANELVPILAEKFGFSIEAAFRIDRSLAEAGMRAKGKGRSLPEMGRREALIFLIACMVTDKITKAADEVSPWLSAPGMVNLVPDLSTEREWEIPDEKNEKYQYYLAMEAVLSPYKNQDGAVTLIDYLLAFCALIEEGRIAMEDVQLTIDFTDLSATVDSEFVDGETFSVIDPTADTQMERKESATGIKRKCTVGGTTLNEIIIRT